MDSKPHVIIESHHSNEMKTKDKILTERNIKKNEYLWD